MAPITSTGREVNVLLRWDVGKDTREDENEAVALLLWEEDDEDEEDEGDDEEEDEEDGEDKEYGCVW